MKNPKTNSSLRTKRSYSLSVESVAFLNDLQKQRQLPSQSETLNRLLLQMRKSQKLAELDGAYRTYYAMASPQELHEDEVWAQLTGSVLVEFSK